MQTFSSETLGVHHDGDPDCVLHLYDRKGTGIITTYQALVESLKSSGDRITVRGPDREHHLRFRITEMVDGKEQIKAGEYTESDLVFDRSDIVKFLMNELSSYVISQVEQLDFDGHQSNVTVRNLLSIAKTLGGLTNKTSDIAEALEDIYIR